MFRHWLIQHADKPRGVMDQSFTFNIPEGVRLKPQGGGPDRVHDAGLYPNATEFVNGLIRRVEAAKRRLNENESTTTDRD